MINRIISVLLIHYINRPPSIVAYMQLHCTCLLQTSIMWKNLYNVHTPARPFTSTCTYYSNIIISIYLNWNQIHTVDSTCLYSDLEKYFIQKIYTGQVVKLDHPQSFKKCLFSFHLSELACVLVDPQGYNWLTTALIGD